MSGSTHEVTPSPSDAPVGLSVKGFTNLTNTAQNITTSPGNLYGFDCYSPNTAVTYVQFYDAAAANVSVGTTVPIFWIPILPGPAAHDNEPMMSLQFFTTAMSCAATTTPTGASAPSSNVVATFYYKG